jgi:predicted Zn-dependent peptidase
MAVAAGIALLPGLCQSVAADAFIPTGLYDAEHVVLENGLRVILKPRSVSRSVSLRLAVDVGHWDFPCGQQQTAHFLEHLLFTGTTDHEESELDTLIRSHGGRWNATTARDETVYEIDIFSAHADLALDTLFEIMSRSVISEADVINSRYIVHREMGGNPSAARQWLYRLGFGKSAWATAWEMLAVGTNGGCTELETANDITRSDILSAYRRYYVPGNMVLVIVGDFEPADMLERVRNTFGQLPTGTIPRRARADVVPSDRRVVVRSSFSPILDSDAFVGLIFRAPERRSPDWAALRILQAYLHEHLFDGLRVDRGLAYAPGAETAFLRDFGLIATYADVYVEDMDDAIGFMEDQINQILNGTIDKSALEKIKRGMLLSEATKYERNADLAEHYVESRFSLTANAELPNEADRLAAVTANDLQRLAHEYLHVDQGMVLRIAPTLTYSQLSWWLGALLSVLFLFRVRRWLRRRNSNVARARERRQIAAREKDLIAGIQRKLSTAAARSTNEKLSKIPEQSEDKKALSRQWKNRLGRAAALLLLIWLAWEIGSFYSVEQIKRMYCGYVCDQEEVPIRIVRELLNGGPDSEHRVDSPELQVLALNHLISRDLED